MILHITELNPITTPVDNPHISLSGRSIPVCAGNSKAFPRKPVTT